MHEGVLIADSGPLLGLAERLDYMTTEQSQSLTRQAEEVSKTLVGLMAVEKEDNTLSRTVAKLTSFLVISMSTVYGLQSTV